ncbi:MAG: response regulator [bacterium]
MPKRIVIIEDEELCREHTATICEKVGHQIVAKFGSKEEAINGIETGFQADIAILDANLTKKDSSGKDGTEIATLLKKKYPNTIIIQYSLCTVSYGYADVIARKPLDDRNLPEILR